jgi:hypothetical protein
VCVFVCRYGVCVVVVVQPPCLSLSLSQSIVVGPPPPPPPTKENSNQWPAGQLHTKCSMTTELLRTHNRTAWWCFRTVHCTSARRVGIRTVRTEYSTHSAFPYRVGLYTVQSYTAESNIGYPYPYPIRKPCLPAGTIRVRIGKIRHGYESGQNRWIIIGYKLKYNRL